MTSQMAVANLARLMRLQRRFPQLTALAVRMASTSSEVAHDEHHDDHDHPHYFNTGDKWWGPEFAAGRDWVGYGHAGSPYYQDRYDNPYPAIRYQKPGPAFYDVLEKEKGDWRKMTLDEKKTLYRYSFKQTFAELDANCGYWKLIMSWFFLVLGITGWWIWFIEVYVVKFRRTPTVQEEYKEAMLQRAIDLRMEPITGVSSKWDYEKGRWKA